MMKFVCNRSWKRRSRTVNAKRISKSPDDNKSKQERPPLLVEVNPCQMTLEEAYQTESVQNRNKD